MLTQFFERTTQGYLTVPTPFKDSPCRFNVTRYTLIVVIRSFSCADTQALFEVGKCKKFSGVAKTAVRKLAQLDAAQTLEFLRSPPGNHLEALKGRRKGQHSVRINDQFRVCFRWTDDGPEEVEIVDYH